MVAGAVFALLLVANFAVAWFYGSRTYPQTTIGMAAYGGKSFAALEESLTTDGFVPGSIEVSSHGKTEKVSTKALKPVLDSRATATAIKERRGPVALLELFRSHAPEPVFNFDQKALQAEAERLADSFRAEPADARLVVKDGSFSLVPSQPGYADDAATIKLQLARAISRSQDRLELRPTEQQPRIRTADLQADYDKLAVQQKTLVTFAYGQNVTTTTPQIISGWFVAKDDTFELSVANIRTYIMLLGAGWGVSVPNLDEVTAAAYKAVSEAKPATVPVQGVPLPVAAKTYRYCTAARGVDASHLGGLNSKLASVFSDSRGWSAGGLVGFTKVEAGCDFTVWLAAAEQMPTFGEICDPEWSCRVGADVVVNFNRWQGASSSWNASGGSLDDYRSMVINHETGHWFDFYHSSCGGAGQAAPVMQQQSIDLQGCTFNPWPLPSEIAVYKRNIGI